MEAAVNTDQQGLQGYEEAMVGMNDAKDDAFSHVSIHSSPSSNAGSVSAGMRLHNKKFREIIFTEKILPKNENCHFMIHRVL